MEELVGSIKSKSRKYLVGRSWSGALNIRQGKDACSTANEQRAGELGVEAQQAGARPKGHAVQQPRSGPQIKNLQKFGLIWLNDEPRKGTKSCNTACQQDTVFIEQQTCSPDVHCTVELNGSIT